MNNTIESTFQALKYGIPTPLMVTEYIDEYIKLNYPFDTFDNWIYENNVYKNKIKFINLFVHYNGNTTICALDFVAHKAFDHLSCNSEI